MGYKKKNQPKNLPKYYGGGFNWMQMGQTVGGMGTQIAANQDLTGEEKQYANEMALNNATNQGLQQIPGYGQFHGAAMGLSNMGRSTIQKDDKGLATTGGGQIADNFMNPTHQQITSDLSKGQYGEAALSAVFNKGVASTIGEIAPNTKFGKTMKAFGRGEKIFAMGGINMLPNAEVEGGENSIAPDGTFTQYEGPTHEQGGIATNLDSGERIFSYRLKPKGVKKSFAELNKTNNTNKEDKVLESNKYGSLSKKTAELMKLVKNKKSDMLFEEQEALKQSKVQAYAKKLGLDPTQFAFGGAYPGMSNPYHKFKGDVPMYSVGGMNGEDPLQQFIMQRYKSDSVPSGKLKKYTPEGKDLTFVDKMNRVPLEGARFQPDSVVAIPGADPNLKAAYKDGKFVIVGTNPKAQQQAAEINKGKFFQGPDKTIYTDYSGYLPKKAYSGMQGLPKYWAGGEEGEDPNMLGYKPTSRVDLMKMNAANAPYNNSSWITQEMLDNNVEATYPKAQSTTKPVVTIKPVNNTQSNESPEAYQRRIERESRDAALLADTSSNKKLNWGEIAGQAGMFAANNAGNFYNLSRYNKPEVETYGRVKANLLNPKQALQDVRNQTNLSKKAMKDVTGGNMANAIANLVGLNSKYNQDIARTNQSYDNANASIRNQIDQYNNQVAMQEIIANARNRARTRSGKGEAIASLGSNTANQFMDNKKGNMDQKTLNLMMQYWNDPNFRKYLEQSGFIKEGIA